MRDNVDSFNSTWFDIAQNKSGAVGADGPTILQRCGRQRGWDNVPAEELAEYYKRSITIPFLDHLLSQLQSRFSSDHQLVARGLSLVPAIMKESASTWKKHVMDLATFYEGDLSSVDNINMEIVCWETKWKDHVGELPSKPK